MNPTFLDNMSWEMAEVYGAVSDQILINLAHYFPWYDESKLPRSTFAYQADMLAQMGKVSRDAVNIIHRNLDGADEALRGILEQAIIDSIRATNPPLLDAAKRGILQPAGVPIVAPNQMRAYSLYYKQAADKLNLVNTVMLESTQQAYAATVADVVARVQATQTALDIGAGEAITGVSSWNQATQHAIKRMADRGITGFIDHGGHRWSAEAYVAMDIRTTVANTARSAVWETNENFGNDLYSVSYHNGARPLCYPWQNKVISATDQARTVTDLDGNEITVYAQSDTTYGQAAGLFGINCKHYPNVFIPGVSLIRGEPQDKEANDLAYEQSQEQRRLERKLREDRRDLMMMKARGVPEEQIRAQQAKCDQSSQDIEDFCDSTGRARRRNREGVYTKRSFPAADTYDVTAFERTQQEQLREYFASGGAQQGYTFGASVPNVPTTPAQSATQATPTTPTVTQNPLDGWNTPITGINDFAELKTYMLNAYGVDVADSVGTLDFGTVREALAGVERVMNDFPNFGLRLKTIVTKRSGVMSCVGDEITFTPKYFADNKTLAELCAKYGESGWWPHGTNISSMGVHESAHGIEDVLIRISGKYNSEWEQVEAWNKCTEAKLIVSEAVNTIKKTPYGNGKKKAELISAISRYANESASEAMAEAFADYYTNGESANPLSIEIFNITKRVYNSYLGGAH